MNKMDFLTKLNLSLKKKKENESMVRTRPIVRSVQPEHVKAYMLSIAVHYCYSCSVDKNITLKLCKEAIQNLNVDLTLNQDKAYDYLGVQSAALKAVEQVVDRWTASPPSFLCSGENTGSNGNSTVEEQTRTEGPRIEYCTVTNKRHKQEDRYFAVPDLKAYLLFPNVPESSDVEGSDSPVLAAGVFDGHNGPEAAEHSNSLAPLCLAGHLHAGASVVQAMGETFHRVNESINLCRSKFRWHSGATGTLCVLQDGVVYTGWLGDSQAWIVLKDSGTVALTDALHRPCYATEQLSVLNNGGTVSTTPGDERVSGVLGVSRGLGDDIAIPGVSPLPSTTVYPLTGAELCLIIGSDGLWDAEDCDGDEVGSFTRQWCAAAAAAACEEGKGGGGGRSLPQSLVDRAIEAGSLDNTTVVVVWLGEEAVATQTSSVQLADARSVRYPSGRRRSAEATELAQLRHCPRDLKRLLRNRAPYRRGGEEEEEEGGGGYLQPPPSGEVERRSEEDRSRGERPSSVPLIEVPLRFSSPTRLAEPTE